MIVERDAAGMAEFRIFNVTGGGEVTFDALTIRNGNAGFNRGGGIFSAGDVTLTNSTVSGNQAGSSAGIYSNSSVTLIDSIVSDNQAQNDEGGILSTSGTVTLTNSTVSNNSAGSNVGGISSFGSAVTLINSTVSGNTAGSGVAGGIFSAGDVTLTNSTVSGNEATSNGGGIFNSGGAVTLTNSTVSSNEATGSGGGIYSNNGGTITNSTITNNTADSDGDGTGDGGGILRSGGTFTISNSIIAGNFDNSPTGNNIHPDVSGDDINGAANNLIGDITGATGTSTIGTGSDLTFASAGITDISEVINPLADNGGTTQTHALIPGSPALDAGNNGNIPMGITTDQRGATRTLNGTVDIGAVEMQFALTPTGTPQSAQVETAFATPLSVQLIDAFTSQPFSFAGLEITFSAPASGASGTFGNGTTVFTDAQGQAINPFTANGIEGNYQVTAEATDAQVATFDLENTTVPVTPPTTPVDPGTPTTPTDPTNPTTNIPTQDLTATDDVTQLNNLGASQGICEIPEVTITDNTTEEQNEEENPQGTTCTSPSGAKFSHPNQQP